ncbi:MAG: hypothetical protein E7B88_04595 [Finegoldia magna]|nr:hypothetical protein [Finegoldia magna]
MKKIEINRLSDYLKKTYGTKVYKLPLEGGFSCPNRKNSNGCIFCSESGSGEFTFNEYSIKDQVELQIKRLSEKKKATGNFEDIMSRFLKDSEERQQDFKKHQEFKARSRKSF